MQALQCGAEALNLTNVLMLEVFLSRMQDRLAIESSQYPVCDRVRFERFMGMVPAAVQFRREWRLDLQVVSFI